jgi:hypothetical protein
MTKPSTTWAEIEAEWRNCFGEPPPIRTSVRLMRKVIRAATVAGYAELQKSRGAPVGCRLEH